MDADLGSYLVPARRVLGRGNCRQGTVPARLEAAIAEVVVLIEAQGVDPVQGEPG